MLRITIPLKSKMYPMGPEFTVGPRVPQHTFGNQSSVSHSIPSGSVDVPLPWATQLTGVHSPPWPPQPREVALDLVTPESLTTCTCRVSFPFVPSLSAQRIFLYPLISATSERKTGSNATVTCCLPCLYWSLTTRGQTLGANVKSSEKAVCCQCPFPC